MHISHTLNLRDELQNYGLTASSIRLFSDPMSPGLLDYLDLIDQRGPDRPRRLLPDGVAESQGRPLLFFVDESRFSRSTKEREAGFGRLRRILACRGDRAYLARVYPGELLVMPVNLSDRTPEWKPYRAVYCPT